MMSTWCPRHRTTVAGNRPEAAKWATCWQFSVAGEHRDVGGQSRPQISTSQYLTDWCNRRFGYGVAVLALIEENWATGLRL
jgi:hypothetical protein